MVEPRYLYRMGHIGWQLKFTYIYITYMYTCVYEDDSFQRPWRTANQSYGEYIVYLFFLASSHGFNWLIYCIIVTSERSSGKWSFDGCFTHVLPIFTLVICYCHVWLQEGKSLSVLDFRLLIWYIRKIVGFLGYHGINHEQNHYILCRNVVEGNTSEHWIWWFQYPLVSYIAIEHHYLSKVSNL